ncbi:radical SAM protein, partial [Tyzzerella sp. OttesenSCG-928-J15]|nr:radical SAM protein [Tyzzerella sp. OttesenSCG-928-J15]
WQSLENEILSKKFKKQMMDFDLFKKAIDGCAGFDKPLEMILFAGLGEPLMHPQIADMVAYAKKSGITKRVDVLTNASLLTKEMADKLIDAQLDRLRISIQGLTTEKYKEVSGTNIEFSKIIDNIAYFHHRRKGTSMYIKIIDCALGDNEKEEFEKIFSPICDEYAVEYLSPFVSEIDYSKLQSEFYGTFRDGGVSGGSMACPHTFYMLAVHPDGSVMPWCTGDIALSYGNVENNTIPEIWHSNTVKDFWKLQLKNRFDNPICAKCQVPVYNVREGDSLNGYEKEILKRI